MSNNIRIIGNKIETISDWNYAYNTNIASSVKIEGNAHANVVTGLTSSIELSSQKASISLSESNGYFTSRIEEGNEGDIYLVKIENQVLQYDYQVSYWVPYIKTGDGISVRNYAGSWDFSNKITIFFDADDMKWNSHQEYTLCVPLKSQLDLGAPNSIGAVSAWKINCSGLQYFFNWNNQLEYNSESYTGIKDAKIKVSESLSFNKILTYRGTNIPESAKNQLLKILSGTGNSVPEGNYNFCQFPLSDIKEHLVLGIKNSNIGTSDYSDLFLDYFTNDNYFTVLESGAKKTLYLRHNQNYARYVKDGYVYIAFINNYSLGVLPIKILESSLK